MSGVKSSWTSLYCMKPVERPVQGNVVVGRGDVVVEKRQADGLHHQAPQKDVEEDVPSDLAW